MNQITTQIKDRIVTKLGEISELNTVFGYPVLDPVPVPAATVTPIGIEPDQSQGENAFDYRVYIYRVDVFEAVQREENNSVETAIGYLYEIGERVMDKFTTDKDWTDPTSFQTNLPTGVAFTGIEPTVGEYTQDAEGKSLILEITIRVTMLVPNQNCS